MRLRATWLDWSGATNEKVKSLEEENITSLINVAKDVASSAAERASELQLKM